MNGGLVEVNPPPGHLQSRRRGGGHRCPPFLDRSVLHMVQYPILQAPRYDGSNFIVTSDGYAEGFAAVLSQRTHTKFDR
ncbi:hypothetical protein BDR07DRAFT_1437863 [Suillus spraguei]|nr:hypothetical protein BDR07DRAFT_1437863 [Suillus spraguei]